MMQAQYTAVRFQHPDYFNGAPHPSTSSGTIPDPYITAPDFSDGFSRGSSFGHPDLQVDYRYLDRGELTSRLCTTSLVDHTLDATGLGFAGDPSSGSTFGCPEDIPAYQRPPWDWEGSAGNGIVAPAPIYAVPPAPTYLGEKSTSSIQPPSIVRSPTAQLPTPAAMAILLNPPGRSNEEPPAHIPAEEFPLAASYASAAATRPVIRPAQPAVSIQNQGTPEALSREKKHGCTMCHKRFDRPSTLKKHLLVHTGEKAFVCETCGRRFGVASNLNRHVKRCILKPVNASPSHKSSTSGSPMSATDSPDISTMSLNEPAPNPSLSALGKRPRTPSNAPPGPDEASPTQPASTRNTSASSKAKSTGQKRRRRAPSPSQWIPDTLQNFNLLSDDSYRLTSVPLPPVRRNPPKEERDSWDENVTQTPYHPCGWRGVLPGPGLGLGLGLGGKDVRNLDLGVESSDGSSSETYTSSGEASTEVVDTGRTMADVDMILEIEGSVGGLAGSNEEEMEHDV